MPDLYAGIASRRTPEPMLKVCEYAAEALAWQGYTLRSGHAPGGDQAFERGAGCGAEIYLPWPTFEAGIPIHADFVLDRPTLAAYDLASRFHPAWGRLSDGDKALHARNGHQILGPDLQTPVHFVLCWSDGSGGTEQALRLAREFGIEVFNVFHVAALDRVSKLIDRFIDEA